MAGFSLNGTGAGLPAVLEVYTLYRVTAMD